MAVDLNEQLSNMYAAASKALANELTQNFYNAAQNRNQAFRQLNNTANASHSLYSGAPAAAQMQYDQGTYLPGAATLAAQTVNRLQANQQSWDEYMDYVKELNDKAAEYNKLAGDINSTVNNAAAYGNGYGGITEQQANAAQQKDVDSVVKQFANGN